MSTLSELVVVADDVATAAYVLINGDATLQDSSRLNATNHVHKETVARDAALPRVLIVAGLQTPPDPNVPFYTFTLETETRMRAVTTDGQVDSARMNRIDKRCYELIIGHGKLVLAGLRFFDAVFGTSSGIQQPDVEVPEYRITTRYAVNCVRIP